MTECLFIVRLPVEIRLKVYEYVLAFEKPIQQGSGNLDSSATAILRTCKTVYDEAIPILYDVNTVVITARDFWESAPIGPPGNNLWRSHVKHVLVKRPTRFTLVHSSQSRADDGLQYGGTGKEGQAWCRICGHFSWLFTAVAALPNIRSVLVQYGSQANAFHHHIHEVVGDFREFESFISGLQAHYTDIGRFILYSPAFPADLTMTFADEDLQRLYNTLCNSMKVFEGDVAYSRMILGKRAFEHALEHAADASAALAQLHEVLMEFLASKTEYELQILLQLAASTDNDARGF